MAIASLLPETHVIGVELDETNLHEAQAILTHRGLRNATFLQSPQGDALPAGIGTFDFMMLSAVFEHLLPIKRQTVMPLLWSHPRPGGTMFVNQTPYRWQPFEHIRPICGA
jgi:predicted O-methyltransferase YrrM